jgi:hypothetical protein
MGLQLGTCKQNPLTDQPIVPLQAHVLRYLRFLSVDVITRNNKLLPFLGKYPTQTKAPEKRTINMSMGTVNYALNIQREWASYILQHFAQIKLHMYVT